MKYLILILMLLMSCTGLKPRQGAVLTGGTILERDGDRYLVLFKDVSGAPHTYSYLWIYQPGLGLVELQDIEVNITFSRLQR